MTSLYNCRHDGDVFRISKFDSDWNVEASYLLDAVNCQCPAGHRNSCRHRDMLPKFINRDHVGDEWLFDFDRGGWVQGSGLKEQVEVEIKGPNELWSTDDLAINVFTKDITPSSASAALPLQPEVEPSPITLEQLDQMQFGRVLHERPSPSPTIRKRV